MQFIDSPIELYHKDNTRVDILPGKEDTGNCLRVELLACGNFFIVIFCNHFKSNKFIVINQHCYSLLLLLNVNFMFTSVALFA